MPKKRKAHADWVITKGRLSRWQREQRRRRIVVISSGVIIFIVAVIFGYGYYDSQVKPFHQTVLNVNDTSIDMGYYINMLSLYGITSSEKPDRPNLASSVRDAMENNEIYRQLALTLGLAVTGEEIETKIAEQFTPPEPSEDNLDEDTPTLSYDDFLKRLKDIGVSENDYREQIGSDLLKTKVREHVGERDVPEEMEQAHIQGILIDVRVEVEQKTPPEEGAEEQVEEVEIIEINEEPEKMLETIKARLDNGEDFAALAEEFSGDFGSKGRGGDLGWMPRGILNLRYSEEFEETAFSLEMGTLSGLIPELASESNTRYWLINVLEREASRPLEESHTQMLQYQAFNDWFTEQRDQFTIEDLLNPDLRDWAIEKAVE